MGDCIAGITSCFITTFATTVSSHGINLSKLRVNAECNINFAKTFDISDEPITEWINFEIDTEGEENNAKGKQKLQQLITMAEERSPFI